MNEAEEFYTMSSIQEHDYGCPYCVYLHSVTTEFGTTDLYRHNYSGDYLAERHDRSVDPFDYMITANHGSHGAVSYRVLEILNSWNTTNDAEAPRELLLTNAVLMSGVSMAALRA